MFQPAAHTDGDVIVFFRQTDVIAAGDVFVTEGYPVIDLSQDGTIQGLIDAANRIIDITIPRLNQQGGTLVVPGHGRIANEADVVEYRDMITIVRDRVQRRLGRWPDARRGARRRRHVRLRWRVRRHHRSVDNSDVRRGGLPHAPVSSREGIDRGHS